jgi:hypothetical protein
MYGTQICSPLLFNHLNTNKRGHTLNKIYWKCFKFLALIFVISVSGLALYIHQESEGFDPIKEIQRLKTENRRDDALDMVKFFKENEQANPDEIESLDMDLEYSTAEKIKSLVWNGSFKGEVFDTYSGVGAISSDLILFGDVRDLVIQSWKYLSKDPDYDKTIMLLSGAGIGLSGTSFINGTDSLAKNTIKYIERFPSLAEKGVMKKFLSGKVSPKESEKLYDLLKKTNGAYPGLPVVLPALTT